MTLSRWLRDYLYIPLGGSANGQAQTIRNIMITMVLGGLWHGAAWTFVVWGALQGVGQSFGHLRRTSRERRGLPAVADGPVRVWVQRFLTFQYVCLGWVFFNATGMSQAFAVLGRVFSGWGEASPLITPLLVVTVAGHHRARSSCPRCAWTACRRRSRARGPPCRSACSASPCSASPPSVPSASRPSSTTASDDRRPHTPAPRRLGVPRRSSRRMPHAELAGADDGRVRLAVDARAGPRRWPPSRVWFLLYAPTLQHNAQVSPVGTRRTVSLDVTGPVAAISRGLQLSHIVSITGRGNGLSGGTAGSPCRGRARARRRRPRPRRTARAPAAARRPPHRRRRRPTRRCRPRPTRCAS